MKAMLRISAVLLVLAMVLTTTNAATKTWTGTSSTAWSTSGNWSPSGLPGTSDSVYIPNVTNDPVISANGTYQITSIYIGPGASLTMSNARTLTVTGNWANDGTFSAGNGTVAFSGTNKTIGGSSTTTFWILAMSSGASRSLNADIISDSLISFSSGGGTITLNNHSVLTRDQSTTSYGTFITNGSGSFTREYTATGRKTFRVGDAGGASAMRINVTGKNAGTVSVTVHVTPTAHPNAGSGNHLNRYWTVSVSGVTQADLTFEWRESDVSGGANQDASYDIAKYNGAWSFPGGFVDPTADTAKINGVTSFSDWTLGVAGALPIQMASSVANVVRDNDVEVSWRTVSETNNYGFEVQRKRGDAGEWMKIAFVEGHGTTLAAQSYSYVDRELSFGQYYYRINQVDLDGKSQTFPEMKVTVGAEADKVVLAQNYPNPFNPSTVIEFVVPMSGHATMTVYNVLGQEVASLFEGNAEAGKIQTARFNASNLPSGMYFYTLRSAGKVETKRMLLMK
ncbi:MAG: T9SS type A sorting domain-containing protein [Bacteroidota bacterium]